MRALLAGLAVYLMLMVVSVTPPQKAAATHTQAKVDGHSAGYWRWIANRRGAKIRTLQGAIRRTVKLKSPMSLERAFLCIHGFEGSWTDPNAPHWGGLQMDESFMRSYGAEFLKAWGTADKWPAYVQMTVAMRAHLSGRGFYPWPNTARACGLL